MRFIKTVILGFVFTSIIFGQIKDAISISKSIRYSYPSTQIPKTISYQGVMKDENGALLPDGNYSMTFSIYIDESGTDALWTETHSSVGVVNGVFTVIIGSVTSLDLTFYSQYYLGVKVGSGVEVVAIVEKETPDLVIMDIRMPGGNGLSATRIIKKANPDIKVVILTLWDEKQLRDEAANSGADAFVIKNKLYDGLIPTIQRLFDENNYEK